MLACQTGKKERRPRSDLTFRNVRQSVQLARCFIRQPRGMVPKSVNSTVHGQRGLVYPTSIMLHLWRAG